jgi:hypothetical protein
MNTLPYFNSGINGGNQFNQIEDNKGNDIDNIFNINSIIGKDYGYRPPKS